jgi:hypothetical protein
MWINVFSTLSRFSCLCLFAVANVNIFYDVCMYVTVCSIQRLRQPSLSWSKKERKANRRLFEKDLWYDPMFFLTLFFGDTESSLV